jgi:TetR/AcrR family transcriptional regulator, tetracycline repressor protein
MAPRGTQGGPALTRRAVIEAALASADAGGLKAITFRRLAAQLGGTPMSLYRYVHSKDALLDALADRVFEEFEVPTDDSADWREQLSGLARSFRRLLIAHPAIAALRTAASPPLSDNQARAVEVVLRTLSRAGFAPQEAALLEIELETFVLAHVMLETGGGTPPPSDTERKAQIREIRARLLTLPPEQFPHIVEAAAYLSEPPDPDWAFDLGLELLIGGFEKILERDGRISRQRGATAQL